MKALWIIGGAAVGRRAFGTPGLLLGAGLGYGLAVLFEPGSRVEKESSPQREGVRVEHESRYPEEAVIESMAEAESDPDALGAEMEEIFHQVSGEDPKD